MKINYHKSEAMVIGGDRNDNERVADIFNCNIGVLPMKYLGVPICHK
jgi:hypothetical protein